MQVLTLQTESGSGLGGEGFLDLCIRFEYNLKGRGGVKKQCRSIVIFCFYISFLLSKAI